MSCTRYFQPKMKARLMAGFEPAWMQRHPRRSYIRQAILSFPPWVSRQALRELRDAARAANATLDHIVPLNNPRVCGLSVPWNLRVLPRGQNQTKSNAWCQWHGELFSEPEQLTLAFNTEI